MAESKIHASFPLSPFPFPVGRSHSLWHLIRMKQEDLRTMVRESDGKPFRICMDDGRAYVVNHPEFAIVGDGAVILGSGPGHDLGGPTFVVCYFDHVSRVELLKPSRKKAA
jgi:hypothetical protein